MNFHVLTLFPDMIRRGLSDSIMGRAAEKGLITVDAVDIRDFTQDKHRKVDDYPYGGGAGLLMQAQPVCNAHRFLREKIGADRKVRTLYLTPQGKTFNQRMAEELSREEELIFLCGHYEGIDERALEQVVTDYVSLGDFVLTGGELPAMVMIDAIARLVPGVLHNDASASDESFSGYLLEYPQYTRPEVFEGQVVPKELLSGDHKCIRSWRRKLAEERTAERRPDLYARYEELMDCKRMLAKNKLHHRDMMELIERGQAELLSYGEDHALLRDRKSGIYLISAATDAAVEQVRNVLLKENGGKNRIRCAAVHQEAVCLMLSEEFGLRTIMCCRQWVYTRKEALPVKADVRRLTAEHLPFLQSHYSILSEQELKERLESGAIYGLFIDQKPVGFIGEHVEGSMGMLFVLPEYRGQGFAKALESSLINFTLQKGLTPFCQVEEENGVSQRLQETLGLYAAKDSLWWMEAEAEPEL